MKKHPSPVTPPNVPCEVQVLQENLKKALALVARAIPSRSTLPVLSNILLATDNGQLKLVATNLEIGITTWIGAKITGEGSLTVPAKLFSDIVSGLPADRITLTLDMARCRVQIVCGTARFHVCGIEADEFPTLPVIAADAAIITFPADTLKTVVRRLAFVTATDDTRPVLAGIHLCIRDTQAIFAAADGYRLARQVIDLPHAVSMDDVIIPARAMHELKAFPGESGITFKLASNKSQAVFCGDGWELLTRLIDGKFPDIERVIPTSYMSRLLIDTQETLKTARLAALLVSDEPRVLHLMAKTESELQPGQLTITSATTEIGESSLDVLCLLSGEPVHIAMNASLLIDALSAMSTPQTSMDVEHPTRGIVCKPVGQDGYIHIVMPLTPPQMR